MLNLLTNYLLSLPRPLKRLLVLSLDGLLCFLAAWLALLLRLDDVEVFMMPSILPIVVSIAIALPIFFAFGLYRAIFRYSELEAFIQFSKAAGIYGLCYFFIFSILSYPGVPRSVGITQPSFLFILVGLSRILVTQWLGDSLRSKTKDHLPGVLIYGSGVWARQLARCITPATRRRFLGFIDQESSLWGSTIDSHPVYSSSNLDLVIQRVGASELWLAQTFVSGAERMSIIDSVRQNPVRVLTLPSVAHLASDKVHISDVRELRFDEFLGRDITTSLFSLMDADIRGKSVLVTGAGGSIGSELSRLVLVHKPAKLILLDHSEFALYSIYSELKTQLSGRSILMGAVGEEVKIETRTGRATDGLLIALLGSVVNQNFLNHIFRAWRPETVYHAAAYKHVSIVESNSAQAVYNNVWGTLVCSLAARRFKVAKFVLVSTDKAVRPRSLMGASKRLAEMIIQTAQQKAVKSGAKTLFSIVRFGNVLNSSGSVLPLFQKQIAEGGPVTVTHPEVTRFFMSIPEAAQLVIQAGAMSQGGEVFVLDMGEPVKILDFAKRLIKLSGLSLRDESNPYGDIEIKITGLNRGEKLHEELLIGDNPQPTGHPQIFRAFEPCSDYNELKIKLIMLKMACRRENTALIKELFASLMSGYADGNHPIG